MKISYPDRMVDGQTIAYKILCILQWIAPTSLDQRKCAKLYNSIPEGKERDRAMSLALSDGYLYGNWPWISRQDEQ